MKRWLLCFFWLVTSIFSATPAAAAGVTLSVSPNQGEYVVDATFDVSLVINTGGQAINALEAYLTFPTDKLQVVSPSTGNSFLSFWINGPTYSNANGTLSFQGGLPNPGITTTAGVISTITFRAKSAGKATIKYQTNSKVLANDGSGTSLPVTFGQASFTIQAAPPAGPVVVSSSHEDPGKWYADRTFVAGWTSPGATDYSFVFDQLPTTIPDSVGDTQTTTITKTVETDGQWYFHIRGSSGGIWGSSTHYVFKVDTSPPASFTITSDNSVVGKGERGLFNFITTDGASGVDHYEVRVILLDAEAGETTAFIEATSPFQAPQLKNGHYRLVVRAVDTAGNIQEEMFNFTVGLPANGLGARKPLFSNPVLINIAILTSVFLLLLLLILLIRGYREKRRVERIMAEVRFLQEEIRHRRQELEQLEGAYQQATGVVSGLPQSLEAGQVPATEKL